MGILNSEVNYDKIITNLSKCCLGQDSCGTCEKKECIVGYAQQCITRCLKEGVTYVENGSDNIPVGDLKIYNEENFEQGIAHILNQCRSCSENHFDNCIVNLLRNCYEIGLFGEAQPYEGSSLKYLNQIYQAFPENQIVQNILDYFHSMREAQE